MQACSIGGILHTSRSCACALIESNVWVQVFYHLGELDDALSYALGAGKLFDINEPSEYVQTTLGEFIQTHLLCML